MSYTKPTKDKQTVCRHDAESRARYNCEFYVSTYNGESWIQDNCNSQDIEKIKAKHLANSEFMNRALDSALA